MYIYIYAYKYIYMHWLNSRNWTCKLVSNTCFEITFLSFNTPQWIVG